MANPGSVKDRAPFSRRAFIASAGTGVAGLSAAGYASAQQDCIEADGIGVVSAAPQAAPTAPFDTFRDWIGALDANGLLMRMGC